MDFRGGERVLEAICELFPEAPVWTLFHKLGSASPFLENRRIRTSFLNNIPGIYSSYKLLLPLLPRAVRSLALPEDTQLVISSGHALIKGVRIPEGAKHLCYIHSPMRYLYDQHNVYCGKNTPFYQRWGLKILRNYLKAKDLKSNQSVDYFIANSLFVRGRVKRYYYRSSDVIHPFVDLDDFKVKKTFDKEDFYLMVSALVPNKKVDLAIRSFNQNGRRLKIVGRGPQRKMLGRMAGPNIEFTGHLKRQEILELLFKARGFVFSGVDDFGIAPLESLAAGTPVVAYGWGGALESLNADVCEFFHHPFPESLSEAVERFEKRKFSREKLLKRASCFSKENFKRKFNEKVERIMQ